FGPLAAYQCGPASLSMVLAWIRHPVPPDELAEQVYSRARQGSLPTDMTGAARRHGLVAYPISTLRAVVTEVAAGNPVIVLQNLGSPDRPRWHYAVVVGYDLVRDQFILRSGLTPRQVSSIAHLEQTWAPSGGVGTVGSTSAKTASHGQRTGFAGSDRRPGTGETVAGRRRGL